MSGQIGAHARALPFTGFMTLPVVIVGLTLSTVGLLMSKVRPRSKAR